MEKVVVSQVSEAGSVGKLRTGSRATGGASNRNPRSENPDLGYPLSVSSHLGDWKDASPDSHISRRQFTRGFPRTSGLHSKVSSGFQTSSLCAAPESQGVVVSKTTTLTDSLEPSIRKIVPHKAQLLLRTLTVEKTPCSGNLSIFLFAGWEPPDALLLLFSYYRSLDKACVPGPRE
jgi:hypothetical protein